MNAHTYIHGCTYMYAHTYTHGCIKHIHIWMHTHTHTWMHTNIHIWMHTHECTHRCTHGSTHRYAHLSDVYLSSPKLFSDETALESKAPYQVILTGSF